MDDRMQHLDDWTLDQLAEGMLPEMERTSATEHVESCERCSAELAGYRALYAALSDMPRMAPSPAFNDMVMAQVRMPQASPVWSWLIGLLPSTRRGWTIVGAALAAPTLTLIGMLAWVMTHPGVSMTSLWSGITSGAGTMTSAAFEQSIEWGLSSGLFGWGQVAFEAVQAVPLETAAVVLGVLALAIPLSAWSLFRLVRAPMGNATYAN